MARHWIFAHRILGRMARREAIKVFTSLVSTLPASVIYYLKDIFVEYKPGDSVSSFIRTYKNTHKEG